MGQLTASITHEVNQPIAAARNNVSAALHFLDKNPPDLQEIREALASAANDTDRAGALVGRVQHGGRNRNAAAIHPRAVGNVHLSRSTAN
jgi:C4-dicarboxylate-specific signal transduction histidine kinase